MYDLHTFIQDPALLAELHSAVAGAPVARVRDAKFKVTARCNLRCSFCRFWREEAPAELGTEEALSVVDDLAALDCRKVHFSGGEPTLRADLPQLVERVARRGMRAALTTNGTCLTEELATALVAAGLFSATLSLDSATPEVHDRLRGVKGTHKRALRGLRALLRAKRRLKSKLRVRLNMVLTRHNYAEYPEVLALAGELGATDVTPLPVDEGGRSRNRLLPAQLQEYNESIAPAVAALRAEYGFSTAPHLVYPFGQGKDDLRQSAEVQYARGFYADHLCYAPWLTTFIAWDGAVYPCCMARGKIPALGNIRESSLRELYTGDAYRAFRASLRDARLPLCHRCDNYLAENRLLDAALAQP
ncbi:MAG: radical SAM protein [Armatimonadota bacterium]